MYLLLKSAPDGLSHMVNELENHIKETGLAMIKSIKDGNVSSLFYYQTFAHLAFQNASFFTYNLISRVSSKKSSFAKLNFLLEKNSQKY